MIKQFETLTNQVHETASSSSSGVNKARRLDVLSLVESSLLPTSRIGNLAVNSRASFLNPFSEALLV